ncbi:MAG: hypothetical protein BWZ10_01214 [candidate division BRC1 bacterium ADurb.BinA364]|nr:MAG: hypothetical protein BWZ10_01214 [candidate division BRC1 bacterium ADurb.BinA364]
MLEYALARSAVVERECLDRDFAAAPANDVGRVGDRAQFARRGRGILGSLVQKRRSGGGRFDQRGRHGRRFALGRRHREKKADVFRSHLQRVAQGAGAAFVQPERLGAETADGLHVVGHQNDRHAVLQEAAHPGHAFDLKGRVAHGQRLVHQQHVGSQQYLHGEGQAHHHAGGVGLDRLVDELADVGEFGDFAEARGDFGLREPKHRAVEEDILAPGEFRIESGAQFEQGAQAAAHQGFALRRTQRSGEDLQQGAFAGPVDADDAQAFAALEVERHVAQRHESAVKGLAPARERFAQPVLRPGIHAVGLAGVAGRNGNVGREVHSSPSKKIRSRNAVGGAWRRLATGAAARQGRTPPAYTVRLKRGPSASRRCK